MQSEWCSVGRSADRFKRLVTATNLWATVVVVRNGRSMIMFSNVFIMYPHLAVFICVPTERAFTSTLGIKSGLWLYTATWGVFWYAGGCFGITKR